MKHIIPKCDFCDLPATYDTRTLYGSWAYTCDKHYEIYGYKIPGMFTLLKPSTEEPDKYPLSRIKKGD